ncbi:MAG: mercury resistance system transport protein MerF [Candidatus Hodarchaeales archaeon]
MSKFKKTFIGSVVGTILIAICCFTPLLVFALGIIGLSMIIPYLDFILLPVLGLFIILTIISYIKWKVI